MATGDPPSVSQDDLREHMQKLREQSCTYSITSSARASKCEHWRSIDLADLKRMGLLKPIVGGRIKAITWKRLRWEAKIKSLPYLSRAHCIARMLTRRLGIHDVKIVAQTENDCTVRYLPGTQFCDLRSWIALGHSLGNFEVLHIHIDALIATEFAELGT